jgi:predicted TIM-barrel fold metal-dependent hydrolase
MIIDIHSHPGNVRDEKCAAYFKKTGNIPDEIFRTFNQAMAQVDKAVVLALDLPDSAHTNDYVAAFVKRNSEKFIGFASVNPKSPGAVEEIDRAILQLGLKGLKLSPLYQNFDPNDPGIMPFYEKVVELNVPTIWHQGTSYTARFGPLEYANPVVLDRVARNFPELKIVISHLGFPWGVETVSMIAKHPNVFCDISEVVVLKSWWCYNVLVTAVEYHFDHKIFFGSDYPWFTPRQSINSLYKLATYTQGTHLPKIPDRVIKDLIHRNPLIVLGIDKLR